MLCLKTDTYLVWILAFSGFPLQRTEESPFFIFNPWSTVSENVDYDLSAGASSSLPHQPQHSCLLSCSGSPLSLKRIHFCGWASHCPDCLLVSSPLLCVQTLFPSPLALKDKFFNILPHRLCLENLPAPQHALSQRVPSAVYLQLSLSAGLQTYFWSQPVPSAPLLCPPSVHAVSRRPLEKRSGSGSLILWNLTSLSSITRLFKVRNFKIDLTFFLQICGNLRVWATSTPWLVYSWASILMFLHFHIQSAAKSAALPLANFFESTCLWYPTPLALYHLCPEHQRTFPECLYSASFFSFYISIWHFYHGYISVLIMSVQKMCSFCVQNLFVYCIKFKCLNLTLSMLCGGPDSISDSCSHSSFFSSSRPHSFPHVHAIFSLIPVPTYSFLLGH